MKKRNGGSIGCRQSNEGASCDAFVSSRRISFCGVYAGFVLNEFWSLRLLKKRAMTNRFCFLAQREANAKESVSGRLNFPLTGEQSKECIFGCRYNGRKRATWSKICKLHGRLFKCPLPSSVSYPTVVGVSASVWSSTNYFLVLYINHLGNQLSKGEKIDLQRDAGRNFLCDLDHVEAWIEEMLVKQYEIT